jgi:hypothetical protein
MLKIKKAAFLIYLEKIRPQLIFLIKMSQILNDRVEVPNHQVHHLECLITRPEETCKTKSKIKIARAKFLLLKIIVTSILILKRLVTYLLFNILH